MVLLIGGVIRPVVMARMAGALLLNVAVAVIGTAILESGFYNIAHPRTLAGGHRKELALSIAAAFVLGCAVYSKWRPVVAEWIWVLGVVGFIWRVLLEQSATVYGEAQRATVGFVSVRFIAYSAGALCCAGLVRIHKRENLP
jgi:hypothetical protein